MAKTILITEDEKALSHALSLKLQHEGYTVLMASDGQACLDMLKSQHIDILLLDLIMPVLDGFQVLEKIQQLPQKPIVFVLSNLSQHQDEERVLEMGARKFFIKSDTALSVIVDEIKSLDTATQPAETSAAPAPETPSPQPQPPQDTNPQL